MPKEVKAPKNISVFLRIRPPVDRETSHKFENLKWNPADPRVVTVSRSGGGKALEKTFTFKEVWDAKTKQEQVYDEFAAGAVDAAFEGLHGVLFVYGQTGSGKTFTISNDDPENLGVLQQGMREAWKRIENDDEYEYSCRVSYVQLYNEILTDLLDAQRGRVRIQLGPEGRGDVVLVAEASGLTVEKEVKNYDQTMQQFRTGLKRKAMASTSMNTSSSRSHTIFTFHITKTKRVKAVELNGNRDGGATVALEGRIVLCDLAGSERIGKTKVEGKTFDEAVHINGSLLALGKVVASLAEKGGQHAGFRESKLTRILQYSLLGNGHTSIVINVSPSDDNIEETISSIHFGQRAIQLKQDAKRHEVLDYKLLYLQLMAELDAKNDKTLEDALKEEREVYEDRIATMQQETELLRSQNTILQKESGGGKSGSKGKKGDPGVNDDLHALIDKLNAAIAERDKKISVIGDERIRLGLLLAEEKRTAFQLAEKLRAIANKFQLERKQWTDRNEELESDLATARGGDSGSPVNRGPSMSSASSKTKNTRSGASSPDVGRVDDIDRANEIIRSLQAERVELIAAQNKSLMAIRLLKQEKDAASRTGPPM